MGNPISLIDPDGRSPENTNGGGEKLNRMPNWASQKGFYVHQRANNLASLQLFSDKSIDWNTSIVLIKQLNKAAVYADSKQFQTSEYSYRHAMRNGEQTVEQAKELADAFVRERYQWARYDYDNGNYEKAYFNLGVALHAIQDATSPAHGGFQKWTGEESVCQLVDHATSELYYSGTKSNLQKETNSFLQSFFNKQDLPEGNIFDNIKIDQPKEREVLRGD